MLIFVILMCHYKLQNDASSSSKPTPGNNQNDDENKESKNNDTNDKDLSTTSFTKGYLTTKGQEVYICLQKGNNYTKMAIDASCTIYELKQKYIKKSQQQQKDQKSNEESNIDDIVLLFMGQVLNDKVM